MKQPQVVSNRLLSAVILLLVTVGYSVISVIAQTAGLPASSLVALSSSQATAFFANLTGCGTAGNVFIPASGTCVSQTGGMVYPGAGIPVSTGSSWSTSLSAPASAVVGISDTQTLTNKSIAGSEINSGSVAPTYQASSETVASSTTPTFSTSVLYSTTTVTAAITSFTLAAGTAGQPKTLTFCENGTGGFSVTAPSNVHGFMSITSSATASKCNSQHFMYDTTQTAWIADSSGVLNE
jgi:hypothetical protein